MTMKRVVSIAFAISILIGCGDSEPQRQEITVQGQAQGTTYTVLYISEDGINHQRAIDSLLIVIDNSMSTYNRNSAITKWNNSEDGSEFELDEHFIKVFDVSEEVHDQTRGLFDPAIGSLLKLWEGQDLTTEPKVDSAVIDSTKAYIGIDNIRNEGSKLLKLRKDNVELNFNAVAQGYTVDVLGKLLEDKGIQNYMVEVGGEVKVKGTNMQDTLWRIGIDRPMPDLQERELEAIVHLDNKALATSGNYRKFYLKDGKKYSHTIDPTTGYPVEHNLLSATVVADNCAKADAVATALMVMGLERAKSFLAKNTEYQGLLIYEDEKGKMVTYTTEGLNHFIELNPSKK